MISASVVLVIKKKNILGYINYNLAHKYKAPSIYYILLEQVVIKFEAKLTKYWNCYKNKYYFLIKSFFLFFIYFLLDIKFTPICGVLFYTFWSELWAPTFVCGECVEYSTH